MIVLKALRVAIAVYEKNGIADVKTAFQPLSFNKAKQVKYPMIQMPPNGIDTLAKYY